ncbi:ecto-NOX disulfide-thiol exchanger 2-like isoform X2 [Haliotis rufescens]|uniref:ecto-NOX disulfide-thiol exchanger 2-like isoform X2 n=1 Tax=Haliotis rufescens TaxID=6454 RepID=UPI00201F789C|nr:ecto-NOX disulfide-thiol exchanger 2-like isoform X2 [Haliotis rufescens]
MSQPSQFIQGMMGPVNMANMNSYGNMTSVGGGNRLDPANNNMPLSFNTGKNKPPMARSSNEYGESSRQVIPDESPSSTTEGMMQQQQQQQQQGNMLQGGSDMYNMGYGGHMGYGGDPSMMMIGSMMNQYGMNMMGQMGPMPSYAEREVITLKSCVLYPPPPGAPPRSVRERPPGCRTAFIGGLPENTTEEILQEVFEKCGNIVSVRLSKKNFSHIRFEFHDSVERALFISGYRMKIDNEDDKANTGRIHVDYALARDDQYEWECQQRALAREMRHQQRIEEDLMRPPSPPPPIVFSEHEAMSLTEKLKSDDDFMNAAEILISWMEKGDCNRRTNASFYSMIQCINSHVRRLLMEKQQNEEEVQRVKQQSMFRFQDIIRQFDQIVRVFSTATKQRAWDHFTKAQRKNIDVWCKQAEEIRSVQQEEFLSDRQEDEMEMSDEDGDGPSKKRKTDTSLQVVGAGDSSNIVNTLKDENDTLKCQMEAYKNEVDLIKQESLNSLDEKDKQIRALQNALQGMQQQLISSQQQMKKSEQLYKEKERQLEVERARNKSAPVADKTGDKSGDKSEDTSGDQSEDKEGTEKAAEDKESQPAEENSKDKAPTFDVIEIPEIPSIPGLSSSIESTVSSSAINLSGKEAKILGLITCFLHVHPFGASVDYLWSYLNQMISCRPREIEDLVERLPMLFKQELQGVGARLERRWVFTGYSSSPNTDASSSFWTGRNK